MSDILILGYGNPLRGDDALGIRAVERLRQQFPEYDFLLGQQLVPEMAEALSRCRLAIFLDASRLGTPGEARQQTLLPTAGDASSLVHDLQPSALLALTDELYDEAPEAVLITGTGACFDGETMSPLGQKALDEVCQLAAQQLRQVALAE